MPKRAITYANSGVDLTANTRWVNSLRGAMTRTFGPRVCNRHGAFAGCFRLDYDEELFRKNYRKPMLVGCADGVGTKVLLGVETGQLYGLGIDLVAMNVNDLVTLGAEPLFFLDYMAVHRIEGGMLTEIMNGISDGCRQAGCALLGGETAEMPDLYPVDHFDLAGFSVGVVEYRKQIDSSRVEAGDVLIGLASSGPHSNGYSLVRKLVRRRRLDKVLSALGESLGDALMRPTKIYVAPVLKVINRYRVKRVVSAMAHITGGGLPENVERVLPEDCDAAIDANRWPLPPVFEVMMKMGVERDEMYRVFNMGIGFVLVVRPTFVHGVMRILKRAGETAFVIGKVRRGSGRVVIKHR